MVSVSGGNVNLHGNSNNGFIEVELMYNLTKSFSTHFSIAEVVGGYDMGMVGVRYAPGNQRIGLSYSGCFMVKHEWMSMYGIDVRLARDLRIVLNRSFDSEVFMASLKIPVLHIKPNKH